MRVKHLSKQAFFPKIGLISLCLLLSCSQTRTQYQPQAPESVDTESRFLNENQLKTESPSQQASNPQGGLFFNQKSPDQTAEEESQQILENFLKPIDLKKLSVAGIDRETPYQQAQEILHPLSHNNNIIHYKEGIIIKWKSEEKLPVDTKRTLEEINITQYYRGPLNFGGNIQERRIGDSFVDQFDLQANSIIADKKAIAFINSLFKSWVNESVSQCFEQRRCSISLTKDNRIEFDLSGRQLFFGNDNRRNLLSVLIAPETEAQYDSCLLYPFDFSKMSFICSGDENSPEEFIQLGESYKDIKYKTIGYGLNTRPAFPRDIPLEYDINKIEQKTVNNIIQWTNPNPEEKPKQLTEDSLLYSVRLLAFATEKVFLMDHSLIQFRLNSDNSFTFSKKALPEDWSPDLSLQEIRQKIEDSKKADQDTSSQLNKPPEQDTFYFYDKIPDPLIKKMESQKELQFKFLQAFFDFYVQEELKKDPDLKTYQYREELDGDVLFVSLILFPSQGPQKVLSLLLTRDKYLTTIVTVFSNPESYSNLDTYIAQNINNSTVDFKAPSGEESSTSHQQNLNERSFSGFQLGDKIYLKNKSPTNQTAIASFDSQKTSFMGTVLYYEQTETELAYPNRESGSYQKGESIIVSSVYINSKIQLYLQATQAGEPSSEFEEYEIIGIKKWGDVQALNLCGIEGLNAEVEISQKDFSARMIETLSQLRNSYEQKAVCPFILSKNRLSYIFPNSQATLQFEREEEQILASIKIYKHPSYQAEDSQRRTQ